MPGAVFLAHAHPVVDDSGTMRTVAAQRLAGFLILGFELCEEAEVPLTDRQKVSLLTSALLEFDGVGAEISGLLQIERLLAELRGDAPRDDHDHLA